MCKRLPIILMFLLVAPSATAKDAGKTLPSLQNLVKYGCKTVGPVRKANYRDPLGRAHLVWVTTCWAEHQGPFDKKPIRDWKLWLSDRGSLDAGNKDCVKWIRRIRKALYRWKLEQKVRIAEPKGKQ
jgi:hypothetical protein